jgi:5'-deoxynucleotidase YfbR-like HD superfamily hydrolase
MHESVGANDDGGGVKQLESTPFGATPPLVRHAYEFAARAHAGQRRKDGQAFITHPARVARLLAGRGHDDEVLAAALLHDVVEETAVTLEALRAAFGDRVAGLVASLTENLALPFDERKRDYRERVRCAPPGARAICAADKVCNLQDLNAVAEAGDLAALSRFRGGLDGQVLRFQAELGMLEDTGVDPALRHVMRSGLDALRSEAGRRRPRRGDGSLGLAA